MEFFRRYQKFFLIIGFIALVVLIGWLLWRVFFSSPAPATAPSDIASFTPSGLPTAGPGGEIGGDISGPGSLPSGQNTNGAPDPNKPSDIALGGLTKTEALTTSPTLDPTLSKNGGVQYYNKDDGRFYTIDKNGQAVALSDKVFYNVQDVVWAPDKDRAVIEYPDGKKIMYNFSTESQVTLPSHWEDFSFSPSSGQLVSKSLGLDPENRWLTVSSDDGSKAINIENIGTKDKTVYPSWSPAGQIVAMYTQGVDFNRQEIFFVGLNDENFKSTIIEGRGLQSQWSTTGDRLLYSVYSTDTNLNPKLWVVDASGDSISQNRKGIDLNTWASKCTFASNSEVYCAVPDRLEKGSGLFPELADKTKDSLYKINLNTGTKELIAVPDGTYNISQIMVPSDTKTLFFTDKKTNRIYKINLP